MQLELLPAPALGRVAFLASESACPGQCLLARISKSLKARAGSLSDIKIKLVLGSAPATLPDSATCHSTRKALSGLSAAGADLCRIHALAGWLKTHGSNVSSLEILLPDGALPMHEGQEAELAKLVDLEALGRSLAIRAVISSLCQAPGALGLQRLQLPAIGLVPASEVAALLQRCRQLRSLHLHHSRCFLPPAEAAEGNAAAAHACGCQQLGAALQQLTTLTHLTLCALSLPCLTGSSPAAGGAQKGTSSHLEQDLFRMLPTSLVQLQVTGSSDASLSLGALRRLGKLTALSTCPSLHLAEAASSSSSATSGEAPDSRAPAAVAVPGAPGHPTGQQPEGPEGAGATSRGGVEPVAQLASLSSLCHLEGEGISLAAACQLPGLTRLSTQVQLNELGRLEQHPTLRHLTLQVLVQQEQQEQQQQQDHPQQDQHQQQQQQRRPGPAWPQQLHSLDLSFVGEGVDLFFVSEAVRPGQGPWGRALAACTQLEALRLPHQLVTAAGRASLGSLVRLTSLTVGCHGLSVRGVVALLDLVATRGTHPSATSTTITSSSRASSNSVFESSSSGDGDGDGGSGSRLSMSCSVGGERHSSTRSRGLVQPVGGSISQGAATTLLAANAQPQMGSSWCDSSRSQPPPNEAHAGTGNSNSSSSSVEHGFLPRLCCLTLQGITQHGQVTAAAARRLAHVKLRLAC